MRRRRNNNKASTPTVSSVDSSTAEKNLWVAYGDPEILDSANNKPYSLRRLRDDVVHWAKLDEQRWAWLFLPFFCFTMYTLRQEVYTWPVVGSIERIDASYMDKLIPSNVDIEVRAEKNIFSADGGLWVTKKGYEDDASSGYFLFSEKKENLVLRLDNLAHTVYFRGSGCRDAFARWLCGCARTRLQGVEYPVFQQ